MALATRCPNCQALFRVGAEQLRSRGGMVRCGSCRRVFNAIAGLDYLDAQRPAADHPAPNSDAVRAPAFPEGTDAQVPRVEATAPLPDRAGDQPQGPAPAPAAQPAPRTARPPALAKPTEPAATPATKAKRGRERSTSWVDLAAQSLAHEPAHGGGEPAEAGRGPDTLFAIATPSDGAAEETPPEDAANAPSFLRENDGHLSRPARVALGLGIVLLAAGLVVQLALLVRSPLIVALPALRPALASLCAPLGCTATWPMRPDLLAVVSSELEAVPGTDAYELDAVLRNRATFALAVPSIELTISDDGGHPAVRRIFVPSDYVDAGALGGSDPAATSIAAGADLSLRIRFAFPGGNAAGFEAYPFYP